ncbi:ABC transporter substrate-binding protein [Dactylosporangium sp. CS-033363]|uniref:ABC transporter substrate-binding protein n=1 Tax=Dactylosporangium sp. CS-033363 TaxID=3239935 RepID=UPI003D8BF8A5
MNADRFSDVLAAGMDRRRFLRFTGSLSAAAAVAAGLSACGGTSNAPTGQSSGGAAMGTAEHPAGTITTTLAFQFNGGFDPMNTSGAVGTCVNQHIFEALVDLDPVTRQPYAALAKTLPTASPDGLTWTATLRDGAKFSDGTPVTADDVAWSFTRVLNPAGNALVAPFITAFLDSVTATGAGTVQFKLKAPFALFPQRIAVIKIVPKAKTGDAAAAKAFDSAPIGSGPFKLDSASVTAGAVLSNNPNYNGPRPALVTQIVMRTNNDNSARLNDLQGGQSQVIEAVPFLNAATVQAPYKTDVKQAFNGLYLMFNCSAAPFSDKRVRQALFYAIDTKKVMATALNGFGETATSYLDSANPDYQRAATVYDYDPQKAKALLAEAGVTGLSFELVTTNVAFIADSAPVIIDCWKQIGVTAKLNTAPTAQVLSQLVPADNFRVLAGSGDPTIYGPDADLLLRWYYYGNQWLVNRARWSDPARTRLAELIDKAATQQGAEQKTTWKQVFDLVADEVPLYMLYHTKTITGSDPGKVTGFGGTSTTGTYFLGAGRAA